MSLDESNELNIHKKPEENALERANLEILNDRKGKYEFDLKNLYFFSPLFVSRYASTA